MIGYNCWIEDIIPWNHSPLFLVSLCSITVQTPNCLKTKDSFWNSVLFPWSRSSWVSTSLVDFMLVMSCERDEATRYTPLLIVLAKAGGTSRARPRAFRVKAWDCRELLTFERCLGLRPWTLCGWAHKLLDSQAWTSYYSFESKRRAGALHWPCTRLSKVSTGFQSG